MAQKPLLYFILTDGRRVRVSAKDAAPWMQSYSALGLLDSWEANKEHPDWMAAEAALTSYAKFLAERKHFRKLS